MIKNLYTRRQRKNHKLDKKQEIELKGKLC